MGLTGNRLPSEIFQTTIEMVTDTVPGHMRAGVDSTPRALVDDGRLYRIGERYEVGDDNQLQQNQDVLGVGGRERASDQEVGEVDGYGFGSRRRQCMGLAAPVILAGKVTLCRQILNCTYWHTRSMASEIISASVPHPDIPSHNRSSRLILATS